ncbi:uncharacterized protein LOC134286712 [Aedes albopictus]|uniref:Uncharacterized protein n=1 Tax=Aedes albopictus TaxID=7160 RepID=A0ABM1XK63_AEDAL
MKFILNIEIKHTYHNQLFHLRRSLATLSDGSTTSGIPENISTSFLESQTRFNEKNIREKTNRTKQKFINILLRSSERNEEENAVSGNPKAIHNGTQTTIPPETEILLSLGPKFALPMTELQQVPFYHLMADAEQVLRTNPNTVIQDQTWCAVGNVITNYIHRMRNRNNQFEPITKFCNKAEEITRRFLKDNPNILVLKSDKGNKTVLMEASEYQQKMLELLENRNTYSPINVDPTSRFEKQNNSIVKRLHNLDLIDERTSRQLMKHNAGCPRIYGQPKAHKPGLPLRPVVPNITAPSYSLSKFVGKIFQRSLWTTNYRTSKIVDDQLKLNGYPKPLRSQIINRMNERNTNRSIEHSVQNLEYTYLSIPNIPHLSNMIDRVIRREYTQVRLAKYNVRKVNNMFSNDDD